MKFFVLPIFSLLLTLGYGVLPASSTSLVDNISLSSVTAQQTSDTQSKSESNTDLVHEGHHKNGSKPSPSPSPSPSPNSKGDSHDHQSHQDHNNKNR